ncbi:MAG TPA: hypothetical protein VG370_18945 [Chloroflexota bacterium]|jgi:hypothetical protein|nr:hypothetical protein [Chloroflexota bacterium]
MRSSVARAELVQAADELGQVQAWPAHVADRFGLPREFVPERPDVL